MVLKNQHGSFRESELRWVNVKVSQLLLLGGEAQTPEVRLPEFN